MKYAWRILLFGFACILLPLHAKEGVISRAKRYISQKTQVLRKKVDIRDRVQNYINTVLRTMGRVKVVYAQFPESVQKTGFFTKLTEYIETGKGDLIEQLTLKPDMYTISMQRMVIEASLAILGIPVPRVSGEPFPTLEQVVTKIDMKKVRDQYNTLAQRFDLKHYNKAEQPLARRAKKIIDTAYNNIARSKRVYGK